MSNAKAVSTVPTPAEVRRLRQAVHDARKLGLGADVIIATLVLVIGDDEPVSRSLADVAAVTLTDLTRAFVDVRHPVHGRV